MAQTLNKPTAIANPNFGTGGSPWTAVCASSTFNEYYVNFKWSASPSVLSDNTFVLELSDATGSFASPTALTTVTDKNSTTDFDIRFEIPITLRGTGYKLRVKSTSPELYSPATQAYNMYYIDYKNPIQITENGSGSIGDGTISICNGSTAIIAVDNVPNSETYQYIWRKSSTILSETGPSLTVSESGMYSVEIDYGSVCSGSAGTLSNMITVETGTALGVTGQVYHHHHYQIHQQKLLIVKAKQLAHWKLPSQILISFILGIKMVLLYKLKLKEVIPTPLILMILILQGPIL